MTQNEIIDYYANLLILQYRGGSKAFSTLQLLASRSIIPSEPEQTIALSAIPNSGHLILSYNGNSAANINFNAIQSDIQTILRAIPGLEQVIVIGGMQDGSFRVEMVGVLRPVQLLVVVEDTLEIDELLTEDGSILTTEDGHHIELE